MKQFLTTFTILLLLLNGSGALYGGWNLIFYPDGSSLQLSLAWLNHTPFQNYLIPGIVLFIVNGLFSFLTLATILFKHRNAALFVITQGVLLAGWIVVQVILIRTFDSLHLIFGSIGILLMVTGWMLRSSKTVS